MGADVSADSEIPAALARAGAEVKRLTWRSAACATSVWRREPVTCARCCRCPPDRLIAQSGGPPNGKSMTATIALVDEDRNILQSLWIALQAEGLVKNGRGRGRERGGQ